jgi:hypothetical protein
MTVRRFRGVEDMPPPWRSADDPKNLSAVARMLALHRMLHRGPAVAPGVRRFKTIQEANADRGDAYRQEDPPHATSESMAGGESP